MFTTRIDNGEKKAYVNKIQKKILLQIDWIVSELVQKI